MYILWDSNSNNYFQCLIKLGNFGKVNLSTKDKTKAMKFKTKQEIKKYFKGWTQYLKDYTILKEGE